MNIFKKITNIDQLFINVTIVLNTLKELNSSKFIC